MTIGTSAPDADKGVDPGLTCEILGTGRTVDGAIVKTKQEENLGKGVTKRGKQSGMQYFLAVVCASQEKGPPPSQPLHINRELGTEHLGSSKQLNQVL